MFRFATFIAMIITSPYSLAQSDKPVPGLKALLDDYAAGLSKAKGAYDEAAKKAGEQYREKLSAFQAERTKAGDLDGAIKVRDLLADLKKDSPDPPVPGKSKELVAREKLAAALSKIVWLPGPGGWGDKFVCGADGFMYMPPSRKLAHTWAVLDAKTVVAISPAGVVDVFEIDLVKGTMKGRALGGGKVDWEATKAK